jgi:beta-glucosidase-like glycosyl hydrolase
LVVTDDLEMGAVTKHIGFEQGVVQSFKAGSDMILICATPELMRRGYHALAQAIDNGDITDEHWQAALRRIAAIKGRVAPPKEFDGAQLQQLSADTAALNQKLNYSYGR